MTSSIALFAFALVLVLFGWIARRRRGWAVVCANVGAAIAALALFEAYLDHEAAMGDGTRMEGSIVDGFVHRDDLLGYAPAKNIRVNARKLYGDSVIYDVAYTTNRHGLRITAPARASATECVVFFGDSITFGEGVEDAENFPYLVSTKTADRYATYNFAFSGYGPHQMLANLQSGRVAKVVDCSPKYFFYLCIPDHAARVAGLDEWDRHGPRFALLPNGSVVRQGNFDDVQPVLGIPGTAWIERTFANSPTWQRFFGRARDVDAADISLLVAVINESARTARDRFPGSIFKVIMWDGGDKDKASLIEKGLKADGIRERRMTDIVPDFYLHTNKYVLSPHDLHPNAFFHRLMADYLSDEVMRAVQAATGRRLDQ